MEIKLELASVPNKPSRNGIIYSNETYTEAIEKYNEKFNIETFKNAVCMIGDYKDMLNENGEINLDKYTTINIADICGKVKERNIKEATATIELKDQYVDSHPDLISDLINHPENYRLGMRMLADVKDNIMTNIIILSFDILKN